MIMNFFGKCKDIFIESLKKLKGYEKRIALAKVTKEYGRGGQRFVMKEFQVGRDTIRKGTHELRSGIRCEDAFKMRGRKKIEKHLLNLINDIKEIADGQSQTDPTFHSTRLYTRLTIAIFRKQLITQKGYTDEELPSNQTLNTKVNEAGYIMKKVQKVKPKKKIPETNAIFENLKKVHEEIEEDEKTVRLSLDTKDRVKVGYYSRGGKSRIEKKANDHDFCNEHVTPFGIMDVKEGTVDILIAQSKVTPDFMVDELEEYWDRHGLQNTKDVLFLNMDNGPENHSRRTQFIKRMVEFSAERNIKIILAYYPPYHSKYNPIERVWGILESHWNGDLLDSKNTVIEFAKTMTYKGNYPNVGYVEKTYDSGVHLDKKTMARYESVLERKEGLEKWFITIRPEKCKNFLAMELIE